MRKALRTTASVMALTLVARTATAQQTDTGQMVRDACRDIMDRGGAQVETGQMQNGSNTATIINVCRDILAEAGDGNGQQTSLREDAGVQPGETIPQDVPDYNAETDATVSADAMMDEFEPLDAMDDPTEQVREATEQGEIDQADTQQAAAAEGTNRDIDMQASEGTVASRYQPLDGGAEDPDAVMTAPGAGDTEVAEGTIAERYEPIYDEQEERERADRADGETDMSEGAIAET
ncbi:MULTISPECIES: hypothetical protein [unclassified Roseitalea]|uniref:hypothetical protein n=1 Tax=unclassified Roseitalea TaxID=2639107 RepID=UPI00273FF0FA|nr:MULTISPECIES: hypothetical protein [unclassified Roseitalea]